MTVRATGSVRMGAVRVAAALAALLLAVGGCSASGSAYGSHVLASSAPSLLDMGDAALESADDGLDFLQQYLNNVLD